jgi:hypothetical protein
VLDLAKIIPKGAGKAGAHIRTVWTYSSGEVIQIAVHLDEGHGSLDLRFGGRQQSFTLTSRGRHFGGRQWYIVCPHTARNVRVLYRPGGAPRFSSRHAWGRRAAYASQFLDPVGRAWRTQAKVKARLIADEDPDLWDLPPKPKRMRQRTYDYWEARYDEAEDVLDGHLCSAVARLLNR